MTAILLHNPKAIFLKTPETESDKVIALWPDSNEDREISIESHIPKKYPNHFKFGFVRHPFDRFVSCYYTYVKDFDILMSFEHFIDKALYEQDYYSTWSLTVRTLPMSNELNLLQHADFIGKYENFKKDIEAISAYVGLTNTLEHVTVTVDNKTWEEAIGTLNEEYYNKLLDYYRTDFNTYCYPILEYEVLNSLSGA